MKKIILISFVLLVGCTKPDIPTPVLPVEKIFDVTESVVTNGQLIHFDLSASGVYTLSLIDKQSGNVISRERFKGKIGENIKKIYTNSLPKGYLYLGLEDVGKNQLKKTIIIIN